ncbi:hypothetical protein EDB86DRAFT_2827458 [Lactarius hatsudake]|nr:hypothetical protein EDB86DRAFT_2827458 [Lactarius hatsudake]
MKRHRINLAGVAVQSNDEMKVGGELYECKRSIPARDDPSSTGSACFTLAYYVVSGPETRSRAYFAHPMLASPRHPNNMPFYDEVLVTRHLWESPAVHLSHPRCLPTTGGRCKWHDFTYYFPDPTGFPAGLVPAVQFEKRTLKKQGRDQYQRGTTNLPPRYLLHDDTILSSPNGLGDTHRPFGIQAIFLTLFLSRVGLALVTYCLLRALAAGPVGTYTTNEQEVPQRKKKGPVNPIYLNTRRRYSCKDLPESVAGSYPLDEALRRNEAATQITEVKQWPSDASSRTPRRRLPTCNFNSRISVTPLQVLWLFGWVEMNDRHVRDLAALDLALDSENRFIAFLCHLVSSALCHLSPDLLRGPALGPKVGTVLSVGREQWQAAWKVDGGCIAPGHRGSAVTGAWGIYHFPDPMAFSVPGPVPANLSPHSRSCPQGALEGPCTWYNPPGGPDCSAVLRCWYLHDLGHRSTQIGFRVRFRLVQVHPSCHRAVGSAELLSHALRQVVGWSPTADIMPCVLGFVGGPDVPSSAAICGSGAKKYKHRK